MRIEATLNGVTQYTARVSGAGFLNAHLNLSNRPKDNYSQSVLRVVGYDTNAATETVSLKWPDVPLAEGDVVQLRVLADGPADPPAVRTTSAESPTNLLTHLDLAKDLITAAEEFERRLFELLERSANIELPDEHKKFKRAVGHALVDLGEHLLSPVYRRHPELVPEAMRGEML